MKRREFLALSLSGATLLLSACGNNSGSASADVSIPNFTSILEIPPLLEGVNIGGILNFDLSIQKGTKSFFEGTSTNTYGVNGNFLGPTLKIRDGDAISINYTNNLDEATTIHGHGMHVPAIMDGGVHQIIEPGASWSAVYTVKQKACTNWYHPHFMGKTAQHVYKGIAGFIIIEDSESLTLDLPKTYGIDDIPLVFQDRFFDSNQEFDYSPSRMEVMEGYIGDVFLTNGVINPYVDVEAKEIRFRLLNGSNSTVYDLGFDDTRNFKQIAADNSFLESPLSLNRIKLSPGERAEIVADFTNEQNTTLSLKDFIQEKPFLKINIADVQTALTTTPDTLTSLEKFTLSEALRTRTFTLSGSMGNFFINGVSMDKNVINETVPINQVEVWEVTNQMRVNHNFHIHAAHFLIVERNGSSFNVADNENAYKDTVFLAPNDSVKLIVKMTDYTDSVNPYMYHCHFLEHEDAGMMGQFIVT